MHLIMDCKIHTDIGFDKDILNLFLSKLELKKSY